MHVRRIELKLNPYLTSTGAVTRLADQVRLINGQNGAAAMDNAATRIQENVQFMQ